MDEKKRKQRLKKALREFNLALKKVGAKAGLIKKIVEFEQQHHPDLPGPEATIDQLKEFLVALAEFTQKRDKFCEGLEKKRLAITSMTK